MAEWVREGDVTKLHARRNGVTVLKSASLGVRSNQGQKFQEGRDERSALLVSKWTRCRLAFPA